MQTHVDVHTLERKTLLFAAMSKNAFQGVSRAAKSALTGDGWWFHIVRRLRIGVNRRKMLRGYVLDEDVARWHEARDYLLGINHHEFNGVKGRQLSEQCHTEEALWFLSLMKTVGNGRDTMRSAIDREASQDPSDGGRALFFSAMFPYGRGMDVAMLRLAAEKGYPLAMSHWAKHCYRFLSDIPTAAKFVKKAVDAGDAYGMYLYARYWESWTGESILLEKWSMLKHSAELGCVKARWHFGFMFAVDTREHWYWTCIASVNLRSQRSGEFISQTQFIAHTLEYPPVAQSQAIFEIGEFYSSADAAAYPNPFLRTHQRDFEPLVKEIVAFHRRCVRETRIAIKTWTLVALRFTSRDMRRLVGEHIWKLRDQWRLWRQE